MSSSSYTEWVESLAARVAVIKAWRAIKDDDGPGPELRLMTPLGARDDHLILLLESSLDALEALTADEWARARMACRCAEIFDNRPELARTLDEIELTTRGSYLRTVKP